MSENMKNKKGKKANSHFNFVIRNSILSKSKCSQVTVFIILAIAIIAILILIFFGGDRITTLITGKTPIDQIRDCVDEPLEIALDLVSSQGGSLSPENYYLYQGNKIEYLCYSEMNYERCVMQKPMLKQSIEKELESYLQPRIKNCINAVKSNLQKKGYSVSSQNPVIDVSLIPNNILIDIQADVQISKDGTESYKSIKTDYNSKLYDLIMITSSILNWEARYGDSETMNYMLYYPSLKVEKKKQSDGTTIYIITDRLSLDKFQFASRSVILPAGITGA
jgi:hypothetical protein